YAFLMPGPPVEMKPMFLNEVRPVLEAMQDAAIQSITLRVFGIGESSLEDLVHPLLDGSNPTAALYAKTGEVHVRVTARAKTAEEAAAMCHEYAKQFYTILGGMIYSENGDDLETATVKALLQKGQSVATAESCTGGLVSERITSVPGASGVFGFGLCSYANEIKRQVLGVQAETLRQFGAVSSQTAAEMAYGAQRLGGATYGVGVTGIAGPDGGTEEKPVGLVYVAVASAAGVAVKQLTVGGRGRKMVRHHASQHALDMVRRLAAGLPIQEAQLFGKGEQAAWKE
ncbi:MAG: nicotinamide-nucleotide amidohydrolase family protein, partial [Oscillospiraceae bacterium]